MHVPLVCALKQTATMCARTRADGLLLTCIPVYVDYNRVYHLWLYAPDRPVWPDIIIIVIDDILREWHAAGEEGIGLELPDAECMQQRQQVEG